jgi:hypothetical protein
MENTIKYAWICGRNTVIQMIIFYGINRLILGLNNIFCWTFLLIHWQSTILKGLLPMVIIAITCDCTDCATWCDNISYLWLKDICNKSLPLKTGVSIRCLLIFIQSLLLLEQTLFRCRRRWHLFFSVSGNAGCIVLLAQAGADVNVTDAHGAYPIHYAANMARDVEKLPEDAPVVSRRHYSPAMFCVELYNCQASVFFPMSAHCHLGWW